MDLIHLMPIHLFHLLPETRNAFAGGSDIICHRGIPQILSDLQKFICLHETSSIKINFLERIIISKNLKDRRAHLIRQHVGDNSAVHPERYALVETMAKDQGVTVKQLVEDKALQKKIDIKKYVSKEVGMPTLTDIMAELDKPGLDPRGEVEKFEFDASIKTIEDLQEGMVVPGIVTNITKFGAFVDIGVHNDGLVHVSQMANRYISDPSEVVKLHEHVMVRVAEVDLKRKRIGLSMKNVK